MGRDDVSIEMTTNQQRPTPSPMVVYFLVRSSDFLKDNEGKGIKLDYSSPELWVLGF